HGEIAPHLHLDQLNPLISLKPGYFIPRETTPWPAGPTRRAGVSSFGFGGTNAHIILQEPPSADRIEPRDTEGKRYTQILPISARTDEGLRALAQRYHEYLSEDKSPILADVCYTAAVGRTHFEHRVAGVGDDVGQLRPRP